MIVLSKQHDYNKTVESLVDFEDTIFWKEENRRIFSYKIPSRHELIGEHMGTVRIVKASKYLKYTRI